MKKTSKEFLEWLGLQVGDRVKVNNRYYTIEINELSGLPYMLQDEKYFYIQHLVDKDFEILPKPKKVGDLKCEEIKDCRTCPLWWLCFIKINEKDEMRTSLYEMLESFEIKDKEVYDLFNARLDKEVVEV